MLLKAKPHLLLFSVFIDFFLGNVVRLNWKSMLINKTNPLHRISLLYESKKLELNLKALSHLLVHLLNLNQSETDTFFSFANG